MARFLNFLPWKRRRLEAELERELRYHLERRVADLKRAGATDEDAHRRAALELGGIAQVQEEVRDTWIWRWADHAGRDLRYAARGMARSPGFTATAVLSLALGIGANAAIFSLVDQVLLRRLPVADPERLLHVAWRGNSLSAAWGNGNLMSYPMCRDLDGQRQFFDGVFCRHPTQVNVSLGGQNDPVPAEIVSGSYFALLEVRPALGRFIDASDDRQPGAHPVVVISHRYWQNSLAGAPDVVGRRVLINNHPMTVIGVAPADFAGVDPLVRPAVWIPAMMKRQATPEWDRLFDRRAAWMHVFGRLRPGVTAAQAKAGLQPWFVAMLDEDTRREGFPRASAEQLRRFHASTLDLLPAGQGLSPARSALARPLRVLMAGTALLLALACLNVASLLVARGAARVRELSTRAALGASQGRIAGQLLVESTLLTLAGGAVGLLAAPALSRALLSLFARELDLSAAIDRRMFLFAFLVSLVVGSLCGLAPVLQARRRALIFSIRTQSNMAAGGAVRLRKAIVAAQMAFTLILLIGAGLLVQTLARLQSKDLGFSGDRLVMFNVAPDEIGYSVSEAPAVMRALLERIRALPDVERAVVANNPVLSGGSPRRSLRIQDNPRADPTVPIMRVGAGFFSAVGATVIEGRDFTEEDARDVDKTGFRTAIVNESFARRYFDGRSPVGRRIGVGTQPDTPTPIEIVGVVRDFSFRNVREDDVAEHAFFPFAAEGPLAGNGTVYMKLRGEPAAAYSSIRAVVAEIDSSLPRITLSTVRDQVDRLLTSERMLAALSSAFGAIALLLAVVGLYGVMSFVVMRRTREIGVRLALGAPPAAAVWLVMRDALIMVGTGAAIGLPAAWTSRRLVEAQLFGVRAFDGPTIAAAISLLALVALGAAMIPAWRAASVSPTEALRLE